MTLADESATKQEVASSGSRLFVILYGGKETDTLSNLRFVSFTKMASSASKILPEKLPTKRAAIHHRWRVHLQVTTVIFHSVLSCYIY